MAKEFNIKNYSSEDILAYTRGLLSPAERHAMEKAALEDPFLADAMEGYALENQDAEQRLAGLHSSLKARASQALAVPMTSPKTSIPWLKVAAMLVLVLSAGLLVYQFGFNQPGKDIALNQEPVESPVASGTATLDSQVSKNREKAVTRNESGLASSAVEADDNSDNNKTSPATPATILPPANASAPVEPEQKLTEGEPARNPAVTSREAIADRVLAQKKEKDFSLKNDELDRKRIAAAKPSEESTAVQGYAIRIRGSSPIHVFRGQIIDEKNNAVPFARITNQRDNMGTYSDARGNFSLTSPDSVLDVQVRSLGYEDQSIALRDGSPGANQRVVLQEAEEQHEELFVTRNQQLNRRSNTVNGEPEPADGWKNYTTYIANNLNRQIEIDPEDEEAGEVEISFKVNRQGEPTDIRVLRSLCEKCDREAIRLVKEGPKWIRKSVNGRTTLTIAF